jgi:hypothetical protein
VNAEQAPKRDVAEADPSELWGRSMPLGETATAPSGSVRVMASACLEEEIDPKHGKPQRGEVVALNENSVRSRLGRVG